MKKIIFILSVALVLIIGGCSNKITAEISREEAQNIAFSDAKVKEDNVSVKKTELETDGFKKIYEIEFIYDDEKYDYEINAKTGEIISSSVKTLKKGKIPKTDNADNVTISEDEAKKIALNHAKTDNVRRYRIEKDYEENGKEVYEIEFISNNLEYEYTIDCETGKILKYSYENAD